MTYANYAQIIGDMSYLDEISYDHIRRFNDEILYRDVKKLRKIWLEYVQKKFAATGKSKTSLGKFLQKFPISFKEFHCFTDMIENKNTLSDFEDMGNNEEDPFRKHRIRYESSQLRRFKLVYKIVNPLTPMKTVYEVSYKAQLALKNKKYTEEYEQLDMALEEEAKRNSPDSLDSLYYVFEPKVDLRDLVVDEQIKEDLVTAMARERSKDKIFKNWGFGKVIEYGRGTTLNFRGPPGTGKTLAANCLAKELGKKLLMVRYDQLQSMWVGQTEKHIQMVFKLAKTKKAVLFFDEADAIALDRSSLEKSWEMSQVNTLLKELERFEGVCIFATNFAEKYDPAFERRLTMHIDFKLPNKEQARLILEKVLPGKALEKGTDLSRLNLEKMSGGDLKNVALNAAGAAAAENSPKIKLEHIEKALVMVSKASAKDEDETGYLK